VNLITSSGFVQFPLWKKVLIALNILVCSSTWKAILLLINSFVSSSLSITKLKSCLIIWNYNTWIKIKEKKYLLKNMNYLFQSPEWLYWIPKYISIRINRDLRILI